MSIQTKLHLWWAWLQIATRHAAEAKRARKGEIARYSFESAESSRLSFEFQSSLAAVGAVAFAMEALAKELEGDGHVVNASLFVKPAKTNAGFYIAQRLIQAFNLSGSFAATLPARLEALFQLRNDSVHFESKYRLGLHLHPNGSKVAYESTVFTLERCVQELLLGVHVVKECARAAEKGSVHSTATAIGREMINVNGMLGAVFQAHDVSLGN